MNCFEYKGFIGSIETSIEDNCLHGKIEFIGDLVSYEAETISGLKIAFIEAVDDYLLMCKELNRKPQKTLTGQLKIKISSDLHQQAVQRAYQVGKSLNDYIEDAIENHLKA